MTPEQKARLIELRVRSKMGQPLNIEEQAFCERMYLQYPDEYPTDREIFKLTEKFVHPLAKG